MFGYCAAPVRGGPESQLSPLGLVPVTLFRRFVAPEAVTNLVEVPGDPCTAPGTGAVQ
jgi:hypothetical protein